MGLSLTLCPQPLGPTQSKVLGDTCQINKRDSCAQRAPFPVPSPLGRLPTWGQVAKGPLVAWSLDFLLKGAKKLRGI